jgi:aspartate/methionine/tyrosine aminotransferase
MKLPPFSLDDWLAEHEFGPSPCRYNLASSTGPVWTLGELLSCGGKAIRDELDQVRLSYAPQAGAKPLRDRVGAFYDVDPDTVSITTGAAEALSAIFCSVAEPGASVALPFPAFPGMPALAQAWNLNVKPYRLDPNQGFLHNTEQILDAVDETTRLVVVNSPHNPTGAVIEEHELVRLAGALAERNIPVLADEVYHPLYFGRPSPSAAAIANTIVVGDLSKAFSLAGLRLGWIIDRDAARRKRLIDIRSYFTVSSSPLTESLAAFAISHREMLLSRLHDVAIANLASLTRFMNDHRDILGWVRPGGGTVAFPWLLSGQDARPLCEALASEGVLIAPGDCFGAPPHVRIGFANQSDGFQDALDVASRVLRQM